MDNESRLLLKKTFFGIAIFYFIYFIVSVYNVADWDLWARMAVGSIYAQTGTVMKHDIFAYTATKPIWVDHEWGSGVIFYYFSHYLGDIGLILLKGGILAGIFAFVYLTNQLRRDSYEINNEKCKDPYRIGHYFLLFFGLIPAFDNTIRSHCFTYFFFALWIYALDLVKRGNNRLIWIFPATMIIWANVHGGFLAGLGLLTMYTIGEIFNKGNWKKFLCILGLSTAVTFINPYGWKYWTFLIAAVNMPRPYVREWDPLNLFDSIFYFTGFKLFVILAAISLIYLIFKHFKKINWSEIFVMGITLYMSLKHQRHLVFFVIAAASYLYYLIYPALHWMTFGLIEKFYSLFPTKLRTFGKLAKDVAVYAVIISIGLLISLFNPASVNASSKKFPTGAVEFIQQNKISGNLLVLFNWGSYALWKLYPECLIAVDGRYEEVYPESLIDEVARFHYVGTDWQDLLRNHHADAILIPIQYKSFKLLKKLNDWKMVYVDSTAAVFVRTKDANKNWIMPARDFNPNLKKYETGLNTAFK